MTWEPYWWDRWVHAEIVELQDRELAPWLAGLLEHDGDVAIRLVVSDLASSRPALRNAALDALRNEIRHWETRPTGALPKAMALADAIAELPPESRRTSGAELAARLLAWADRAELPVAARSRLRTQLAAARVARSAHIASQSAQESTAPARIAAPTLVATSGIGAPSASAAQAVDSSDAPSVGESKTPVADSPRLLSPEDTRRGLDDDDPELWELSPRPTNVSVEPPSSAAPLPAAPTVDQAKSEPGAISTRQWISNLHGESSLAASAREELRRRGFDDDAIELAARLSSPDVKERVKWTAALPQVSKIDTRAWLTWMTEDESPEVRRTAVTLLATSLDEPTLARLRQLAVRDPDPKVRRLAGELIRRE